MGTAIGGRTDEARLAANRRRFDELVGRAEDRLAAGDPEGAAVIAQVAAALGWHSPTGLFASPRLEACLALIAARVESPLPRQARPQVTHNVLHVLTTAYPVGGHTRLAWRWIERDESRRHSVALTRQGREALPEPLVGAVTASGGRLHRVDRAGRRLTDRASVLAGLCAEADLVVMHVHPFDVVPPMALAAIDRAGGRPPTILVNHADHLFWIGLSSADVVAHLRASGARLSEVRRGLPAHRSAIVPVPLVGPSAPVDRPGARRALGYAERDVLAVSIASGYKFGLPDEDGLLPVLEAALAECPALSVLAVGPGGRADWRAAAGRWGRRLRALDVQQDLSAVLAAADIYLDSHPFSSLTSMLEAGQRAIPLLAYGDPGVDARVLAFDDPATADLALGEPTRAGYVATLRRLVDDPGARLARGRQIEGALAACHEGRAWLELLETAYARAVDNRASDHATPAQPAADPPMLSFDDLDRRLLYLLDAQQRDAPRGVRGHLRFAPFRIRLEEWRRSRLDDQPLSALVLLPEWVLMLARRASMLPRPIRCSRRAG